MEEEYPVDFEMMNYYIATHPASFFTHNILASTVTREGRVNIMNQDVRAGAGCLNSFSASISGASAGVRLPSGEAAA